MSSPLVDDLPRITADHGPRAGRRRSGSVSGRCMRRVLDRDTGTDDDGRDPVRVDPGIASARRARRRPGCCGCSSAPKAGTATDEPDRTDAADRRRGPSDRDDDQADDDDESAEDRRVRSTRRRQDAPDLPRVPLEDRTVGRVFTAPDGTHVPAVDVPHPHPAVLRAGHPGTGAPVDPAQL